MKYLCLAIVSLLIGANLPARSTAVELVLTDNFRLGEATQMPGPAEHPDLHFERKVYGDENAVEWQVVVKAPANGDSTLYDDLKSADFIVDFPSSERVTLHWSNGSHAEDTDFRPRIEPLSHGKPFELTSFGGRSSDGVMPYFNLATSHGGLIVAIGWSGDWKASFESFDGGKVRIAAGLKRCHFKLGPGEQLRLPSVLVMGYRGNWIDGQNQFRRLLLRYFTPTSHAPMQLMPVAASVHGIFAFNVTSEEKLVSLADDIAASKLPIDTYWLDAGWNEQGFPGGQGNPDSDAARFPHGLGPLGEKVHRTGMRFLAWFEPERVMRGTWLDRERSDWLLSPSGTPSELRYMETDGFRILDFGSPEVRRWALENVSRHIRESRISIYRQDFNAYPSYFWHTEEAPDQIGLREVRYINGLYEFLDELARSHPGLILDNCASGGRRLDFEMMRRSVVLWRSDSCWDSKSFPRNVQAMTHGLSYWLPLHGLGALTADDVSLRTGMGACASFAINWRDPIAVDALRRHLDRYLEVRRLFAANFYPLTDWSSDPTRWLAFQFHDPATGEGIVQAFCGSNVSPDQFVLKLQGLDSDKQYVLSDWDNPTAAIHKSGLELTSDGIEIKSQKDKNTAIVLRYKRD